MIWNTVFSAMKERRSEHQTCVCLRDKAILPVEFILGVKAAGKDDVEAVTERH